jgi:hypothetical protein
MLASLSRVLRAAASAGIYSQGSERSITMPATTNRTLLEHDGLKLDESVLRRQVEVLNEVTETPQFHGLIEELREAPPEARRDLAKEIQWVDRLKDEGVAVPPGLRMTERAFEDPTDGHASLAGDFEASKTSMQPQMGACISIGYYVCVSYG